MSLVRLPGCPQASAKSVGRGGEARSRGCVMWRVSLLGRRGTLGTMEVMEVAGSPGCGLGRDLGRRDRRAAVSALGDLRASSRL